MAEPTEKTFVGAERDDGGGLNKSELWFGGYILLHLYRGFKTRKFQTLEACTELSCTRHVLPLSVRCN